MNPGNGSSIFLIIIIIIIIIIIFFFFFFFFFLFIKMYAPYLALSRDCYCLVIIDLQ